MVLLIVGMEAGTRDLEYATVTSGIQRRHDLHMARDSIRRLVSSR
jgi:hypothetical protein